MKVYVPTPQPGGPAADALRMEGIEFSEVRCLDRTDYGEAFTILWNRGEAFIVVEWDVVPWPGAIAALADCPDAYCTHRYPLQPDAGPKISFGIGKYRPEGEAPSTWAETPWHLLDGFVIPEVHKRLGQPCVHEPPVAHARRPR